MQSVRHQSNPISSEANDAKDLQKVKESKSGQPQFDEKSLQDNRNRNRQEQNLSMSQSNMPKASQQNKLNNDIDLPDIPENNRQQTQPMAQISLQNDAESRSNDKLPIVLMPLWEGVSKTLWKQLDYNSRKHILESDLSDDENQQGESIPLSRSKMQIPEVQAQMHKQTFNEPMEDNANPANSSDSKEVSALITDKKYQQEEKALKQQNEFDASEEEEETAERRKEKNDVLKEEGNAEIEVSDEVLTKKLREAIKRLRPPRNLNKDIMVVRESYEIWRDVIENVPVKKQQKKKKGHTRRSQSVIIPKNSLKVQLINEKKYFTRLDQRYKDQICHGLIKNCFFELNARAKVQHFKGISQYKLQKAKFAIQNKARNYQNMQN